MHRLYHRPLCLNRLLRCREEPWDKDNPCWICLSSFRLTCTRHERSAHWLTTGSPPPPLPVTTNWPTMNPAVLLFCWNKACFQTVNSRSIGLSGVLPSCAQASSHLLWRLEPGLRGQNPNCCLDSDFSLSNLGRVRGRSSYSSTNNCFVLFYCINWLSLANDLLQSKNKLESDSCRNDSSTSVYFSIFNTTIG